MKTKLFFLVSLLFLVLTSVFQVPPVQAQSTSQSYSISPEPIPVCTVCDEVAMADANTPRFYRIMVGGKLQTFSWGINRVNNYTTSIGGTTNYEQSGYYDDNGYSSPVLPATRFTPDNNGNTSTSGGIGVANHYIDYNTNARLSNAEQPIYYRHRLGFEKDNCTSTLETSYEYNRTGATTSWTFIVPSYDCQDGANFRYANRSKKKNTNLILSM